VLFQNQSERTEMADTIQIAWACKPVQRQRKPAKKSGESGKSGHECSEVSQKTRIENEQNN